MKIAVYPGSFDPITFGHIDIIERAVTLFDKVIVTVSQNFEKTPWFTAAERCEMIKDSVSGLANCEVDHFKGLLVDYVSRMHGTAIIRGLRALSDFEFEFKMALMNRSLAEDITTVFMMPHARYTHVSSSLVREVAGLGGDVSMLVPDHVARMLKKKLA
ncbi:MAG: pantetheine-phosphate adenylyltransferase [FCB group bacterium]|nr:pantetheine-phosphate adenylyltransferase [FCB group bacterium]